MTVNFLDYSSAHKDACLKIFDGNVPDYFDNSERDDFAHFLDDPDGRYFVLKKDDQIIGCGGFAKEEAGQARLTWGMVDRQHHKTGMGELLARHRLAEIERRHDLTEVELFTTPKVAPFFQKLGFVAKATEKDGFAPGMDKVQMIKRLR